MFIDVVFSLHLKIRFHIKYFEVLNTIYEFRKVLNRN